MSEMEREVAELRNQLASLEEEVNWLADYIWDRVCTKVPKPCVSSRTCRECVRAKARRSIEQEKTVNQKE